MKKIVFLFGVICSFSCVYEPPEPKIGIIKNESAQDIILFYNGRPITDTDLFYGSKYTIAAKSAYVLTGNYRQYPKKESPEKVLFYLFNSDSVKRYLNLNKIDSIVSRSFVKNYTLSIDKLGRNDTIIIYK